MYLIGLHSFALFYRKRRLRSAFTFSFSLKDYWDSINLVNGEYEKKPKLVGICDFVSQVCLIMYHKT